MSVLQEQEYASKFDVKLWRTILRFARPYRRELYLLTAVMILTATIDALFPLLTKIVIDNYIVPGTTTGIWRFGALYGGLVILQGLNIFSLIALAGRVETGVCYTIRTIGFRRLQELPLSFYDTKAVGWLMARMTSDILRLGEIISWGIVDMVWGGMSMIAFSLMMLYLNWRLALVTLAVLPLLLVISLYFQKQILAIHRRVRQINSRITGAFNEGITGAKTTKTLCREESNLDEFSHLTKDMRISSIRAAIFSSLFLPIVLTLSSIGTALVLFVGGEGVMREVVSYGVLVAFISYTVQFFEPVRELARIFAEIQAAHASAERVTSMINTEVLIKDSPDVVRCFGDSYHPDRSQWPLLQGDITFENVSFWYAEGEPVLENFNLHVSAGETVALVGETGSGKSTLVNLACRFYEPVSGRILIDGVDYRQRPLRWLHENLGYVLQSPHLFSGSIRENIRYGRLEATDKDVIRAARLVNAHGFITELEKGYDTEVGEGGGLLSTGEKQLVSFARAVLADPKLFVLDEATSSIDTESEQIIQAAIRHALEGRTSFIIAHRLSTIRAADRILVIRDGKIEEEGNHNQLIAKRGYYYRLYTNQFIEEQGKQLLGER